MNIDGSLAFGLETQPLSPPIFAPESHSMGPKCLSYIDVYLCFTR